LGCFGRPKRNANKRLPALNWVEPKKESQLMVQARKKGERWVTHEKRKKMEKSGQPPLAKGKGAQTTKTVSVRGGEHTKDAKSGASQKNRGLNQSKKNQRVC